MATIINPYSGVDFAGTPRVPANSHEHIYAGSGFQGAYRRGIRAFACVNYFPSAPSVAPSGKLGLQTDQNFASWDIPVIDWADPNNVPENFFDMTLEELAPYLTTRHYQGAYPTITDGEGDTVQTAGVPQIANMEFAFLPWQRGNLNDRISQHFNLLGNLYGYPTNGMTYAPIFPGMTWDEEKAWRAAHPLYSMADLMGFVQQNAYRQFDGKIFGTINHNDNVNGIKRYLDTYPDIFKAMECFNQYYSRSQNELFRSAYDTILRQGYRIYGTAAVDWPNSRETYSGLTRAEKTQWIAEYNALTPEEQGQYGSVSAYYEATAEKECGDADRGCNVLYIPNYDSLLAQGPKVAAEAALDAYIAGRYYMSAWGQKRITAFSVNETSATFTVSESAQELRAITDNGRTTGTGNTITIPISSGTQYVRFEAYFNDADFIFTNPVFFEDWPTPRPTEEITPEMAMLIL